MWLEIVLLLYVILVVWITMGKSSLPSLNPLGNDQLMPELRKVIATHRQDLEDNGYEFVEFLEAQTNKKIDAQLAIYINQDRLSEVAIMATQYENQKPITCIDISSTLFPHGELNTNTSKYLNFQHHTADHFLVKMPWIKNVSELYVAHIEHLQVLAQNGFVPTALIKETIRTRIFDTEVHTMELQVQKRLMKKTRDGKYRLTLLGAVIGVPKIAIPLMIPIFRLFVGRRSKSKRLAALQRQTLKASQIPEKNKMVPEEFNSTNTTPNLS